MPNFNAPFGLVPVRYLDGRPFNGGINEYGIASALAENIGYGSLVIPTGTTNRVSLAADGTVAAIGVFLGVRYRATDGSYNFKRNWASGTVTFGSEDAQALVADAPDLVFEVQATTFAAADVGQFAGMTVGAPDVNGRATTVLNGADITGTADRFKILRLSPRPRNGQANEYGAFAVAEVSIGIHVSRANTAAF